MTVDPVEERLRRALAGRYAVVRQSGRGGMATVYLAEDDKHSRHVALKVLHPELAASLGAERFLREIQIASRLQHPHILPLYDSGQVPAGDGWPTILYYVMPFVQGESLRERLRREGPLPLPEAVRIARDVAAALDYAHRQGVLHRDVKPENVMLHEGEAMLADFGIAKPVSGAGGEHLTATGLVVGTPAYMSPEQAAGGGDADGRTDIYSLGCVLYEMLAGQVPFTGASPQAVIARRFTEPPPSIRAARPSIPAELDQVVSRALAREPSDRYARASQLALVLGAPTLLATTDLAAGQAVPARRTSIAVLPFTDMSPAKDQDWFCEGMAEEILNALSRIETLHVASRSSAFAFKGPQDVRTVGDRLGVGTIVEGSVRKSDNQLRISVQLVEVASGYQVWSHRYDRELVDVFAVQDEIAGSIARALRVVLSDNDRRAIEKKGTTDLDAYEAYLRGRQYFYQFRKKSVEYARRMFERALELDPSYALAHAGAADSCAALYSWWDASAANLEAAERYSRRALELAPDLAEAHEARGVALTLRRQYAEAEAEFHRAVTLNPGLFEARYFLARASVSQGKYEEAARQFEQASEVRPDDYQSPILLAAIYEALGRTGEAAAADRRGVALAEARLALNPDESRALVLGANAHSRLGNVERALELAEQALAVDPDDSSVLYNVACAYARIGRVEDSISCLERAIQHGFGYWEWLAHDSDLDPVRSHPRFVALRRDQ